MSEHKGKDKTLFPRIDPDSDNIRSEVAKDFGISGERKNISTDDGASNYLRMSVESQMSGVPVYTKKDKKKK